LLMNQITKERIFSSFSVTAFLGFTLFVFGPSYIYFTNALEFSYTYSEILKYCLFLFLAAAIFLGLIRTSLHYHLSKMATLPNPTNADLERGFTVPQVAEKHNWTEPMVWSLALEDKEDLERFKEVGWGLRTWDQWEVNDCLPREIHGNDSLPG